jgi:two-component system response regulator FixJ
MSNGLVHLVDDDEAVRDSFAFLLKTYGYEVHLHVTGSAFLGYLDSPLGSRRPACVLLDINMPGPNGLIVQNELNDRRLNWPVIILTGQADIAVAIQAMKNGAADFFEKPVDSDILLKAMAEAFIKLRHAYGQTERVAQAHALVSRLTQRERQVMGGLLAALPNKVIAHELDLSVRTVEIYRAKVMTKLQARGLSAAVRLAIDAGLEPLAERRGF